MTLQILATFFWYAAKRFNELNIPNTIVTIKEPPHYINETAI